MIPREQVLTYLHGKQDAYGGYTGNDITKLAEFLNVTSQGLNRRLAYWIQNDNDFSSFIYLGKEKPSITLSEFLEIPLPKSSYYRKVDQTLLSQYSYEKEYRWFESQKITIPEDYSIEKNRESLSTLFTFSDLKTYGGANLNAIYERLTRSKEWFSMYDVKADRFYS